MHMPELSGSWVAEHVQWTAVGSRLLLVGGLQLGDVPSS
jgi:hypothetical protein